MKKHQKLTVENLRKSGAKVRILHSRVVVPDKLEKRRILALLQPKLIHLKKGEFKKILPINLPVLLSQTVAARGGITHVEIDTKTGSFYQADAHVHPADAFCKREGVSKCLKRIAIQAAKNGDVLI